MDNMNTNENNVNNEVPKAEQPVKASRRLVNHYEKLHEEDTAEIKKLQRNLKFKDVLIIILIIIIIILLLVRCSGNGDNFAVLPTLPYGDEDLSGELPSEEIPEESITFDPNKKYVTFPVLSSFSVSWDKKTVEMYNPIENEGLFNLCYTFTDEKGNVIYDSGMREAGEYWDVNFYDLLSPGPHKVRASLSSEYVGTDKRATGTGSDIIITVK